MCTLHLGPKPGPPTDSSPIKDLQDTGRKECPNALKPRWFHGSCQGPCKSLEVLEEKTGNRVEEETRSKGLRWVYSYHNSVNTNFKID